MIRGIRPPILLLGFAAPTALAFTLSASSAGAGNTTTPELVVPQYAASADGATLSVTALQPGTLAFWSWRRITDSGPSAATSGVESSAADSDGVADLVLPVSDQGSQRIEVRATGANSQSITRAATISFQPSPGEGGPGSNLRRMQLTTVVENAPAAGAGAGAPRGTAALGNGDGPLLAQTAALAMMAGVGVVELARRRRWSQPGGSGLTGTRQ